jgi:hypothetical protein
MTSGYVSSSNFSAFNERTGNQACSIGSNNGNCDRNFILPGSVWSANNVLEPVSDLDIATSGGLWYDPSSVTDKPLAEMMFYPRHNIDERSIAGYLAPGEYAAFWLQQHILPNVPAHTAIMGNVSISWY